MSFTQHVSSSISNRTAKWNLPINTLQGTYFPLLKRVAINNLPCEILSANTNLRVLEILTRQTLKTLVSQSFHMFSWRSNSHAWHSVCTISRPWSSAVRDPVLFFIVKIFIYTLSFRCLNKVRHHFPTEHVGSIDSETSTRPSQWITWKNQSGTISARLPRQYLHQDGRELFCSTKTRRSYLSSPGSSSLLSNKRLPGSTPFWPSWKAPPPGFNHGHR